MSALDEVLEICDMPEDDEVVDAARAELAALRATVEAQAAEAQLHTAWVQMVHRRTVEADKAYNEAHSITAPSMPDLGVLVGWLLDERKAQAKQIVTMVRAASRACDVMSECIEHNECAGADRAEMKAAKQQLLDALLGNSSGTPNASQAVVPIERLREPLIAPAGVEYDSVERLYVTVSLERLREIEWVEADPGTYRCPQCVRLEEKGHAPDCWLAAAIKGDTCHE